MHVSLETVVCHGALGLVSCQVIASLIIGSAVPLSTVVYELCTVKCGRSIGGVLVISCVGRFRVLDGEGKD